MYAQAGEIVDSWIEEDNKEIAKILDANSKKDRYWILLFQQVTPHKKLHFCGARPMVRTIRVFAFKPPRLVGCVIGEVDNKAGEIKWEVFPKDIPYKDRKLLDAAKPEIYTSKIPNAYIYNKVD